MIDFTKPIIGAHSDEPYDYLGNSVAMGRRLHVVRRAKDHLGKCLIIDDHGMVPNGGSPAVTNAPVPAPDPEPWHEYRNVYMSTGGNIYQGQAHGTREAADEFVEERIGVQIFTRWPNKTEYSFEPSCNSLAKDLLTHKMGYRTGDVIIKHNDPMMDKLHKLAGIPKISRR